MIGAATEELIASDTSATPGRQGAVARFKSVDGELGSAPNAVRLAFEWLGSLRCVFQRDNDGFGGPPRLFSRITRLKLSWSGIRCTGVIAGRYFMTNVTSI